MNLRISSTASTATLVVALVVGAAATGAVAGSMVTGAQIKNESVTGKDIKNGSLKSADLDPAAVKSGPVGPAGPAGSPAAAIVSGQAQLFTAGSNSVSMDGTRTIGDVYVDRTPNVPVVLRNFTAKLSRSVSPSGGRTREFKIDINGVQTTLCTVVVSQTTCSQGGSVTIPAGSEIFLYVEIGPVTGPDQAAPHASWGMTLGTS